MTQNYSTIFKQETVKSWFSGVNTSKNNEVIQPFQNAENVIEKYNLAIQHNSLTQQGWQRLLAQSDDSLKAYLTSIKGTTASMAGYNASLQGNITGFSKVSSAIKQYNTLSAVGDKEQNTFATAVSTTNGKLGTYLTGLSGAKASLSGYGISLIASTAKTAGLTIATTALNATLTMGISLIVSGLISAFTAWIHKSEEITKAAQEAKNKISSIKDELKTNTETVENAKKRYAELAQEVENLGKISQSQGTLSNEEYEEFLDLSNQLASIFPSLSKNYDENGNAILDLSGNVDTIIGTLDNLIQKEKEFANQKIMEEFPDVFAGWSQDLTNAEQDVKNAKTEFDKINQAYNALEKGKSVQMGFTTTGYNSEGTISIGQYEGWLKDLGLTYEETIVDGGRIVTAIGDINTAFTSKLETARKDLQYAQQQLEGKKSSIDSYLNTWLQTEPSYNQIENSGLQKAIQEMLFNFDWSSLPEGIDKNDWEAVSEYLRRNILFAINNVQDNDEISTALSEIFTNAELTPDEKTNYLKQIQDYFGEDNIITISLKPQIDDTEVLQKQYQRAVDFAKDKFDGYDPTEFFKEQSINTQEEIDEWQKIAQGARNAAEAREEYLKRGATEPPLSLSDRFKNLWDSESFKDAKENLEKISKESKITADDINSIAEENKTLFDLLNDSGMSAQFAAECFDSMCRGGKGFDAITSDALLLDQVLNGMTASLQQAKAAKSSYDEAMSKDDYNTEFKNYQEAYASSMEMFKNGEYGRHFRDTMQYLLGEDSFTMSIEELEEACKDLDRVFGENAANGYEFLDRLYSKKDILDGLDSSLTRLSDGTYKFDLKPDEFEAIADAIGMTTEEVAACVNALGMFGDYRSYDLDELELAMNAITIASHDGEKAVTSLQGVKNILMDLGKSDYEIAGMIQDIKAMGTVKLVDFEEGNIDKIISTLKELEMINIDGKNINLDSLVSGLKQMGSSDTDITGFIERLNGLYNLTDAQGKLVNTETAKNQALSASKSEAGEELSVDSDNAEAAKNVSDLGTQIDNVNQKSLSQVKLQFIDVSTAAIDAKNNVQDIINRINTLNNTKINVSTTSDSNDTSEESSGKKGKKETASNESSKGTFDGDKNFPKTNIKGLPQNKKNALQSKYGQPELTVSPNETTEQTINRLPRGTVSSNEKQTKKSMDGNKKTSDNANITGTAKKPSTSSSDSGKESGKKSDAKSGKKPDKKSDKETKKAAGEIFDWIERRIKKFQRKFDKWLKQAETAVTSRFISRYYKRATAAAKNELSAYGRAYNRYMKEANSAGLSGKKNKKYRDKVKNGTIDIQSIRDEKLAEKIKKYQEYYDKAQEATASFVETAEKLYSLPLDKAASKIEKFSDAIDLLDKKLDNAAGSKAKNKIIDKQTEEKKNILDAYKEANKETKKNLKSAGEELTKSKNLGKDDGITAREKKKIKEAVKNGKEVDLAYFKVGSDGYNAAVKYNDALKKHTESTYDLQSAQEDYKSWLSDASMQKFENIQSQYESELGLAEHGMDMVNINISKAEALGHVVSGSYYKSLMAQEQENINTRTKERDELQKALDAGLMDGSIEKYSDEWYEMKDAINGVTKSINEATVSVIEYKNQLRQLEWDRFDRQQDYISQIQSESGFLTDLMGNEKMFDDNGRWTKYADATAGLYAVNYNAYMSQADDYAKELAKIDKELAKDHYNTDLVNRKQELIRLQQESIKNAENEKASIRSLVSDGYSALLDAVKKITDEYKNSLSAQKDLYDYEKSIAKQTKNISTLEKQALSLEGDDSEETRAKLQKIKTELEDARNELNESEYERWIKDQEQMLDSITSGMEDWINERLDNIDALVAGVIANTNANSSEINDTIKQAGKDVGYSLTPEMEKIWNTGNGISSVVSMYGKNFDTGLTTVNSTLESIRDLVQSMSDASDAEAFHEMVSGMDKDELAEKFKNSGHKIPSAEPGTSDGNDKKISSGSTLKKADTFNTRAVKIKIMDSDSSGKKWGSWFKKKKYTGNKSSLNKNGSVTDRLRYLDYDSSLPARKSYYSAMGGRGTYTETTAQNTWMLSEMKKHGFKNGGTVGGLIKKSGEDGFVLARTGEEILSLDKIRELGKAFESINAIVPVPDFSRTADTGRNSIDNVNIEFTLPNVKNYDEFMSRMRTDRRFEGMVQNMTLGNALGRNSFNKLR